VGQVSDEFTSELENFFDSIDQVNKSQWNRVIGWIVSIIVLIVITLNTGPYIGLAVLITMFAAIFSFLFLLIILPEKTFEMNTFEDLYCAYRELNRINPNLTRTQVQSYRDKAIKRLRKALKHVEYYLNRIEEDSVLCDKTLCAPLRTLHENIKNRLLAFAQKEDAKVVCKFLAHLLYLFYEPTLDKLAKVNEEFSTIKSFPPVEKPRLHLLMRIIRTKPIVVLLSILFGFGIAYVIALVVHISFGYPFSDWWLASGAILSAGIMALFRS